MKRYILMLGTLLVFSHSTLLSATVNGRFTVVNMTSAELSVLLQINTDTGTDDLGGATIVFSFDTTAIHINQNPVKNVDYIYHNFSDGNYSPATVTRPMKNTVWVNIDLPYTNNNNGTIVAASPGWTDVVTIRFDILDPNGAAHLSWQTASPFWGIYDADNSTLWQTGAFEDLFGPLPVELISFTGTLLPDQNVLLEWKTASELNHYGFEIERASSLPAGKAGLTTPVRGWEMIGFVESYGDPSSLVEYSFTDVTPYISSILNYRLKSIDNDGTFQYSDIIEVNTLPTSYGLSQNYPNPFNPSTKIKFTIPNSPLSFGEGQGVRLIVYDVLGNEVAELVDGEKQSGTYEVEFNGSNFSSGVYLYRLTAGSFSETKKLILLK